MHAYTPTTLRDLDVVFPLQPFWHASPHITDDCPKSGGDAPACLSCAMYSERMKIQFFFNCTKRASTLLLWLVRESSRLRCA